MSNITRSEEIQNILARHNAPAYTQTQLLHAIYKTGATDYMNISTIPLELRAKLKEQLGDISSLKLIHEDKGDQADKVLLETRDHERIEAVRMLFNKKDDVHESLCISSQSGCALGCKFCATGAVGLKKNLTVDEIVDQILFFKKRGDTIGSISFMGMGEPFANPDLFDALKIITDPVGLGISPRRLSVSTVGLVPGIKRLTEEFPQINLAFSLHSPFPNQRLELMPITKAFPVGEVFKALDEHIKLTNKKVFIAYVLLGGVNDTVEHARQVVKLIKARGALSYLYHVNLIRYHPGPTIVEFDKPEKDSVIEFMKIIKAAGIHCTLRQSFGVKIDAACGQLYAKYNRVPLMK